MAKLPHCAQCGMTLAQFNEYHPYAACLMFMQCQDGDTVRANFNEVFAHAVESFNSTSAAEPK